MPAAGDLCGSRGTVRALEVIGLTTDQRLLCFTDAQPGQARMIGPIGPLRGLVGGERLVGIDFRPSNGKLYGFGDGGGLYVIDTATAAVTLQARLQTQDPGGMPVRLRGRSFGMDFNPVPDRLRLTSDAGENLRVNVDNGVVVMDSALNPAPGTGLNAVAYTNNDGDPGTGTVLYDLDTASDQLMIQSPPNAGSVVPVGSLGVNIEGETSFDIFSVRDQGGTTAAVALASVHINGQAQFAQINLTTGRLLVLGNFRPMDDVIAIAIPLVQSGMNAAGPGVPPGF